MSESPEKTKKLPFPTAPIVRLMREHLDKDKLIKKEVKDEMNKWLGMMTEKATKKMNEKPYTTVDLSTFKEAVQIYKDVEEMEKEKNRVVAHLEKIKQDCESLIRDLDRKFKV